MAAKRILLLEDDAHLAGVLLFVLQGAGYIVDLALTVTQAERRLSDRPYGLGGFRTAMVSPLPIEPRISA